MTGKMILRPGTPDDDNREYLPEKIKGSDIVVNENGNNSQPYPERLKECHGVIADNIEDEWYEYVPESYDPSKKTPLVLSMHGGLMTGWGQAIYTSWTMAADRDGFILVFPPEKEEALKVNKDNRLYWMRLNECGTLPEICIRGENNFAFYKGRKADLVYLDIKNRDHGQSFDDAALIWDYFFSGLRREVMEQSGISDL